jgi:hypothetical protein
MKQQLDWPFPAAFGLPRLHSDPEGGGSDVPPKNSTLQCLLLISLFNDGIYYYAVNYL